MPTFTSRSRGTSKPAKEKQARIVNKCTICPPNYGTRELYCQAATSNLNARYWHEAKKQEDEAQIHHNYTEKVEDHIEIVPWKLRETKHSKENLSQEKSDQQEENTTSHREN
jgi:hypothetical protein